MSALNIVCISVIGLYLVGAVFNRELRRSVFQPEVTMAEVYLWVGLYYGAKALGIHELQGLELIGVCAIALIPLLPLALAIAHYKRKWWSVESVSVKSVEPK